MSLPKSREGSRRRSGPNGSSFDIAGATALVLTTVIVVVALSAAWAAVWLGAQRLDDASSAPIDFGSVAALAGAALAGIIAALPTLFFQGVRSRARTALLAPCCALVAFALGETLVVTIELWGALGIVRPSLGATFAVVALRRATGSVLLARLVALFAFVGASSIFARRIASKAAP